MPSACESDCCVTVRNASLFHMPKACLYLRMKEILIERFKITASVIQLSGFILISFRIAVCRWTCDGRKGEEIGIIVVFFITYWDVTATIANFTFQI